MHIDQPQASSHYPFPTAGWHLEKLPEITTTAVSQLPQQHGGDHTVTI